MKRLLSFVIAIEVLGLITACQTTSTGANTASQKETLLGQAGFKWKTVTTPKQQERASALPEGKVSAVKFKGRTYYVYPTATKDRILVGNQAQFNAYKQSLQAQRNQLTGPVFEEEIHGPSSDPSPGVRRVWSAGRVSEAEPREARSQRPAPASLRSGVAGE